MKRVVPLLLVIFIVSFLVGCSTPKEKVADYVKSNGMEFGSKVCLSYNDYFLDNYNTYFIVYDSNTDSFSFEYYSSNKYFETPPTSNYEVNNSVTIDLSNGKVKYYSYINGNAYTGTATINIASYNKLNNSLSDVIIDGKYEQVYTTIEQAFEQSVFNTVTYIETFLSKENSNISVEEFGFTTFGDT